MEELGPQVRDDSRAALCVRWPQRAARLPNSCGGPLPPPQAQPVVASHPRPLAAMSCRNLRRWPELDHFVFKVLPCSASAANEPDTIVRSLIRQCSLGFSRSCMANSIGDGSPAGSFLPLFNTWRFPNSPHVAWRHLETMKIP